MYKSATLSNYKTGMDARQREDTKGSNRFTSLWNCSINTENEIQKRPGMDLMCNPGTTTEGLFAFDGKLWTLWRPPHDSTTTPPTEELPQPADGTELWLINLRHQGVGWIQKLHYAGSYLGGIYLSVQFGYKINDDTNLIYHYYISPSSRKWTPNYDFEGQDPKGFRVIPSADVNETRKQVTAQYYFEARALGRVRSGIIEPWLLSTPGGNQLGFIYWRNVSVFSRNNGASSMNTSSNELAVFMAPTPWGSDGNANRGIFWATNVEPGEGVALDPDLDAGDFVSVPYDGTIEDGDVVWKRLPCWNWASNRSYKISYPIDLDLEDNLEPETYTYALSWPSNVDDISYVYIGTRNYVQTGATEPNWNSTTVHDGAITWQRKGTRVTDAECPNSPEVIAHQSKIYALGSGKNEPGAINQARNQDDMKNADRVKFCVTGDPFDWSTPEDAGFLPSGVQTTGSDVAKALGKYNDGIVVLLEDSIQLWAVDPDPQRNALEQLIGDIGTTYSRTVTNVGTDLVFLSEAGFRSIGQQASTANIQDTDVGTPIDSVVKSLLSGVDPSQVTGALNSAQSQYWCNIGNNVFVWTWSRNSDVRAWAQYELAIHPDYFANLENRFYLRAGNGRIIKPNPKVGTDYSGNYLSRAEWDYQSFGLPGVWKQFMGVDAIIDGEADIRFLYDSSDTNKQTLPVRINGNTRPGQMTPVEVVTPGIAPVIEYTGPNPFRVKSVTLYFEKMETL